MAIELGPTASGGGKVIRDGGGEENLDKLYTWYYMYMYYVASCFGFGASQISLSRAASGCRGLARRASQLTELVVRAVLRSLDACGQPARLPELALQPSSHQADGGHGRYRGCPRTRPARSQDGQQKLAGVGTSVSLDDPVNGMPWNNSCRRYLWPMDRLSRAEQAAATCYEASVRRAASGGRNSRQRRLSACGRRGRALQPGAGARPMAGGLDGGLTSSSMVAPNAATLAASLYPSWQQGLAAQAPYKMQALPMERGVSWGAELLPFIDEGEAGPLMSALSNNTGLDSPPRGDDGRHDGMLGGAGMMQRPGGGGGGGGGGGMPDDGSGAAGRPVHKQRFVWTSELHRRFEAAVNTLGVDQPSLIPSADELRG